MGRAAALRFAQEGAAVAICARDRARLEETAAEMRHATGAEVLAITADVTALPDIERLVAATLARYERIDALVCNAGGPPALRFAEAGETEWERALDLSLRSTLRLVRAVLPGMRSRRSGSVVAITSTTVIQPSPGLVLSTVPRLGVAGLFKALSREYGPEGIRFNVVCPGGFRTDRTVELLGKEAADSGRPLQQLLDEAGRDVPLRRLGEPAEMGDVIAYLCSARASYITGALIPVDGGATQAL
jgi:3-oxoacyl-[acyl-carrier protein] reductase